MITFRQTTIAGFKILQVWGQDYSGREVLGGHITHTGKFSPSRMVHLNIEPEELRAIADMCILIKNNS